MLHGRHHHLIAGTEVVQLRAPGQTCLRCYRRTGGAAVAVLNETGDGRVQQDAAGGGQVVVASTYGRDRSQDGGRPAYVKASVLLATLDAASGAPRWTRTFDAPDTAQVRRNYLATCPGSNYESNAAILNSIVTTWYAVP